ncbi:MAG: methyltransferase domain-containing protein, partial [Candidatus Limnocylindrales bacterium]
LDPGVERAFVVLADQPWLPLAALEGLSQQPLDPGRPIVVPTYDRDGGRNPVLLERAAFALVATTSGNQGLGPWLADHPDVVREVAIPGVAVNPDVDTPADLRVLAERAWADQVAANADQVERIREVPDGADFYAPVTSLFRADPRRTDEPALEALLGLVEPADVWLDIGAGAGRYALPIAVALAPSGGSVVALDPSASMLRILRETAQAHGIDNVQAVHGRWPLADAPGSPTFQADVALIAHVGYDIAAIGPFLDSMEASARRQCIALLMERQPAAVADVFWPPVHGQPRERLPALPEFVDLLRARGRTPEVRWFEREVRLFGSSDELEGFVRRQLWIAPGSQADARFRAAFERLVEIDPDGRVGPRDQRPIPLGIVSWLPPERR